MSGRIAGYVSRFDTADRAGDVVRQGAFAGVKTPVPLLWAHDPARPIGRVIRLEEDAAGLRMVAELAPGAGDDALRLVRAGAATGLSFGYRVKKARGRAGGGRELLEVELVECSVVALPLHEGARVTAVTADDQRVEMVG